MRIDLIDRRDPDLRACRRDVVVSGAEGRHLGEQRREPFAVQFDPRSDSGDSIPSRLRRLEDDSAPVPRDGSPGAPDESLREKLIRDVGPSRGCHLERGPESREPDTTRRGSDEDEPGPLPRREPALHRRSRHVVNERGARFAHASEQVQNISGRGFLDLRRCRPESVTDAPGNRSAVAEEVSDPRSELVGSRSSARGQEHFDHACIPSRASRADHSVRVQTKHQSRHRPPAESADFCQPPCGDDALGGQRDEREDLLDLRPAGPEHAVDRSSDLVVELPQKLHSLGARRVVHPRPPLPIDPKARLPLRTDLV